MSTYAQLQAMLIDVSDARITGVISEKSFYDAIDELCRLHKLFKGDKSQAQLMTEASAENDAQMIEEAQAEEEIGYYEDAYAEYDCDYYDYEPSPYTGDYSEM